MEPAFHRGDILFLHMGYAPFRAGDIVVFKVADREIPIVHRVIKVRGAGLGHGGAVLRTGDCKAVRQGSERARYRATCDSAEETQHFASRERLK
jgi:hypothetical protein